MILSKRNICLIVCAVMLFACFFTIRSPQIYATTNSDAINSKAYVLMEYGTGEILDEQNMNKQLPIASVTKLMTILLTLESLNKEDITLDKKIVISKNAASMGGSQIFLDANSEYEIKNLVKAVIISSANDASVALAEEIGGSEQGFVEKMNQKAKELNLENTNYVNCTGLPAPSQYSCAKDVAVVFRELLKYPLYFEICGIWMEDFIHPGGRITGMSNTNKLIKFYNGCDAGKTGSTNEAGFCLATTAKRNNMRLISVVLGAETSKQRFADASNLLNFGFNNYQSEKLVGLENLADKVVLEKSSTENLSLVPEEEYYIVSKKGQKSNYSINFNLPEKLYAPLKKGDVVGKIIITKNNEIQKKINIIVEEDVDEIRYFKMVQNIFKNW